VESVIDRWVKLLTTIKTLQQSGSNGKEADFNESSLHSYWGNLAPPFLNILTKKKGLVDHVNALNHKYFC